MTKSTSKRSAEHVLAGAPEGLRLALRAAFSKKADHVTVLDLRSKAAFTDYFAICSGQTPRQVKAIVDAVEDVLRKAGIKPLHIEGYTRAEWVLIDGFDFLVHVFTPDTREFYSLERLWGSAEPVPVSERDLA
jgi:ribosome-associated protein